MQKLGENIEFTHSHYMHGLFFHEVFRQNVTDLLLMYSLQSMV